MTMIIPFDRAARKTPESSLSPSETFALELSTKLDDIVLTAINAANAEFSARYPNGLPCISLGYSVLLEVAKYLCCRDPFDTWHVDDLARDIKIEVLAELSGVSTFEYSRKWVEAQEEAGVGELAAAQRETAAAFDRIATALEWIVDHRSAG